MAQETQQAAILTPTQRRFLAEGPDEEMTEANARMTRARIRERVGSAIIDFLPILRHMDEEEFKRAFTEPVELGYNVDSDPAGAIPNGVAVLYLGTCAGEGADLIQSDPFEEHLSEGIARALNHRGVIVDRVDVDIDIEVEGPADETGGRDLAELPQHVREQLLMAGEIELGELLEAQQEQAVIAAEEEAGGNEE